MKTFYNFSVLLICLSVNHVFAQSPNDGEYIANKNITIEQRAPGDLDDDGVLDEDDIDSDNDGLIDSYECSVSIQFDTPSLLTATDLNDLLVGEKVVYTNALLFQNQFYDIVLTLTSITGSLTVDVNTELEVIGFNSSIDNYVTYSFDLVEAGSATTLNPNGTPVSLNNIIIGLQDVDHSLSTDYTEISGFNTSTLTSNVTGYLSSTTLLESGGFVNGAAPANFSLYRLDPTSAGSVTDWIDEPNDSSPFSDDFTVFMAFDIFSHVDLLLGVTGTESNVGLRHTHFIADSNCDYDNDSFENKVDIDSDNDGIPDNVEAQLTSSYILPTGSVNGSTGLLTVYGSGLIPVDTDGDNAFDFTDSDSDNDSKPDITENGMANSIVTPSDTDADGLDDIFETNGINDATLDINEDIEDPTDLSILPDTDLDLPLGGDLDYRDAIDVFIPSAFVDFDGIDDHISQNSFMTGWQNATLMAWIKLDPTFILDGDVVGEGIMRMYVNGATKKLHSYYVTSAGSSDYGSMSNTTLQTDHWYHVAISYEGASGMTKMYIDGELDNMGTIPTGTLSTDPDFADPDFNIGRHARLDNSYFKGGVDEVRVFSTVLTENQIQQMVYQEIDNNTGTLKGAYINKDIKDIVSSATVPWTNLQIYYPMTNILTGKTTDASSYGRDGTLKNILTVQSQSAPMPYETASDGAWNLEGTWLHGDIWDIENGTVTKPWSIVHIKNEVTTAASHTQLGMFIDTGEKLTVTGDNEINNTWYFELNGTLDLSDDSQLVQTENSDLVTSDSGKILRRQEGNSNVFWYNYWSSPVGTSGSTTLTDNNGTGNNTNNTPFNLSMLKNGTGTPMEFTSANDEVGKISNRWLYSFQNGLTFWDWVTLSPASDIMPGVGYTQKGTGVPNIDDEQQYTFEGKPNNGTILIPVTDDDLGLGESVQDVTLTTTLVGNPYPSALDARKFISDNIGIINSTAPAIQGTILLWEQWAGSSHFLAEYEGGYGYINLTETERAYQHPYIMIADPTNPDNRGIKTPTPFIPVGQGFFVEVINNGDIEFNNTQRVFKQESMGESIFLRATQDKTVSKQDAARDAQEEDPMQIIRLEFAVSNGATRRFVLGFSDHTTDGLEYGYDGGLIIQTPDEDMTSLLDSKSYVIQAFSPITPEKEIDLNLNASGDHTYSLEIVEMKNIDASQDIYLKDNQEGVYWDLRQGAYNFSANAGLDSERFDIVFKDDQTLDSDQFDTTDVVIYNNRIEHTLYVKGLDQNAKALTLTNMLGQAVKTFTELSVNELENGLFIGDLSSGVYLVNLVTDNSINIDKKIILE